MKKIKLFFLLIIFFIYCCDVGFAFSIEDYYLKLPNGEVLYIESDQSWFVAEMILSRMDKKGVFDILYPDKIALVKKDDSNLYMNKELVKKFIQGFDKNYDEFKIKYGKRIFSKAESEIDKKLMELMKSMNKIEIKTYKYSKGVGCCVEVGTWYYAISSVWWLDDRKIKSFNMFNEYSRYSYLGVYLRATNWSKRSSILPPIKLVDNEGNEYDPARIIGGSFDKVLSYENVNPSLSVDGWVIFDVPKGEKYRLKLTGGIYSDETAYVDLDL